MSARRRLLGAAAGAGALAAAGIAVGVARQRRSITGRGEDPVALGSLRGDPITVVSDDGVALHVEVDELPDRPAEKSPKHRGRRARPEPVAEPLTVVFVHGYALNLDCWHFQRLAYRGLIRTVFYDQRSHGRSERSSLGHATIDQLGSDLAHVLDAAAPDGKVVLVGHSMGGMSIIALAEQRPELFGDRVVGVGLIATTAGGIDPSRILLPVVPAKLGQPLAYRTVRALARGHRAVDGIRKAGRSVAMVTTDLFAFGDAVPPSYVEFVDQMLSGTPFEVVAEFFPSFRSLDKFHVTETLARVPTVVIGGTRDRLTSIGHSRKLHSRIEGSRLLECERAGHMVIMERHEQVNAALDQLISAAAAVGSR